MPIMNPSLGGLGGGLKKPRKYRNVKCEWRGEKFDSKKELERHLVLLDMQKRGEIASLKRQVTFKLIVNGQLIGSVRPDWTYDFRKGLWENNPQWPIWKKTAEDAKGVQTPDHKTRWKLAIALYPEIDWRLS